MSTSLFSDSKTGFIGIEINTFLLHLLHFTIKALNSLVSTFFILPNIIFDNSAESNEIKASLRGGGTGGARNSSNSFNSSFLFFSFLIKIRLFNCIQYI